MNPELMSPSGAGLSPVSEELLMITLAFPQNICYIF